MFHHVGQFLCNLVGLIQGCCNGLGSICRYVGSQQAADPDRIAARRAGHQQSGEEKQEQEKSAFSHMTPTAPTVGYDGDHAPFQKLPILFYQICCVLSICFFKKYFNILCFLGK